MELHAFKILNTLKKKGSKSVKKKKVDEDSMADGSIQLDQKRLKKDLSKILKSIKGEDRVLIVGTTKDLFSADLKDLCKDFCKVYSKIILVPRPDNASRYVMWKRWIRRNGGKVTEALDISSLAKISDGYTQGHMVQVVRSILSERLAPKTPHRRRNWYSKTPLGKKRGPEGKEEAPVKGGKDASKKEK